MRRLWWDVRMFLMIVWRPNPYADKPERFSARDAWEIARASKVDRHVE